MRLINLETLQLEELNDNHLPKYAILSHTWQPNNEITYSHWQARSSHSHLPGYRKILGFRDVARSTYGCKYGWVDTCCIDKSSSAELTEAINSMFAYYSKAAICIVYLADVFADPAESDEKKKAERITSSRWMTRGWTLQELIAPSKVSFYDSAWVQLGDLSYQLAQRLETAIAIPARVLVNLSLPADFSVGQRMSWASRRETTRVEDRAYSLLGLFDVSLPLVYGEGERAFLRLQEEIIRSSTDHSIFAWHFEAALLPRSAAGTSTLYKSSPQHQKSPGLRSFDDELGNGQSHGDMKSNSLTIETDHLFEKTASSLESGVQAKGASISPFESHPDASRRLLAPSPALFRDCHKVVECYLDVRSWVVSYEMSNLGLGISLPLVPCTSHVGLYHAVLNCRFSDQEKGPIAINLKRTSQARRLHHINNVDLATTTFGVVRMDDNEYNKFSCNSDHLDRLSIVEEEALISQPKTRVTILRTYSPMMARASSVDGKKVRLASIRLPRASKSFQPERLKVTIMGDLDGPAQRSNAIPDQWDSKSHIWFVQSLVGAISFVWERHPFELTFVFAVGTERDVPFHLALFETTQPMTYVDLLPFELKSSSEDSINQRYLKDLARSCFPNILDQGRSPKTDGLKIGQVMSYDLHFATIEVRMEKFDRMSKVLHLCSIAVMRKQPSNQIPTSTLLNPGTAAGTDQRDMRAVQHRGKETKSKESDKIEPIAEEVQTRLQEEVVGTNSKATGFGQDGYVVPLRRQFSFEDG